MSHQVYTANGRLVSTKSKIERMTNTTNDYLNLVGNLRLSGTLYADNIVKNGVSMEAIQGTSLPNNFYSVDGKFGINEPNPTVDLDVKGVVRAQNGLNSSRFSVSSTTDETKQIDISYKDNNLYLTNPSDGGDNFVTFRPDLMRYAPKDPNPSITVGTSGYWANHHWRMQNVGGTSSETSKLCFGRIGEPCKLTVDKDGQLEVSSIKLGGLTLSTTPSYNNKGDILKISNENGTMEIGTGDANWGHISTSNPKFAFNAPLWDTAMPPYDEYVTGKKMSSTSASVS
jgi:hypothetical protein